MDALRVVLDVQEMNELEQLRAEAERLRAETERLRAVLESHESWGTVANPIVVD